MNERPERKTIKIKAVSKSGRLPEYETSGSSGMDIRALVDFPVKIRPGERFLVPTGLFLEIPQGFEVQIRARSGLAIRNGIALVNGIGTVDSDYRGEIMVPLINLGEEVFTIHNGDRIAQMVVCPYVKAKLEITAELEETDRGAGGFGSTGKA